MSEEQNHSTEEEIVVMTDEDGNEFEYGIAMVLKVEGKRYAILTPANDRDSEDGLVALRIEGPEDNEDLVDITDDDEFEVVALAFDRWLFGADEAPEEDEHR